MNNRAKVFLKPNEEKEISLVCRKRLGRPRIEVSRIGERFNPFENINNDVIAILDEFGIECEEDKC